jgi:hypothetical protein
MNTLKIFIDEILDETIQGISYKNTLLFRAEIDGTPIIDTEFFEDGFIVFSELIKSKENGLYYIFCEINGIADEGAWEGVEVKYTENVVNWCVRRGGQSKSFTFERDAYIGEIERTQESVERKPSFIPEPSFVFPPE